VPSNQLVDYTATCMHNIRHRIDNVSLMMYNAIIYYLLQFSDSRSQW